MTTGNSSPYSDNKLVVGDPLIEISVGNWGEGWCVKGITVAMATTAKAIRLVSRTSRPSCSLIGIRIMLSRS